MIIDTHSHLNFKAYDNDRDEVIKRTQKEEVVCIDVGTKFETSKKAVELAEKNENIFAAIGMHPIHVGEEEFDKQKYLDLAKSKKVVAIGEIGLDNKFKNEGQKKVFLQQLDLARDLDLPIIIHCRMAHEDLIKILGVQAAVSWKNIKGVIHCFTGGVKELEQYLNLGFYIGLNGIIFSTFSGSPVGGKLPLDDIIKQCPIENILVETDCPYLTPLPAVALAKAGPDGYVRNEPIFIKHVIQKIADLKGMNFDEVAFATTQNAKKLFKI